MDLLGKIEVKLFPANLLLIFKEPLIFALYLTLFLIVFGNTAALNKKEESCLNTQQIINHKNASDVNNMVRNNQILGIELDISETVVNQQKSDKCPSSDVNLPTVLLGLFVSRPTPFLSRYFESIAAFDYPRKNLHIFIYNGTNLSRGNYGEISNFLDTHAPTYASVFVANSSKTETDQPKNNNTKSYKTKAVEYARELSVDFYFHIDPETRLANPSVLRSLIKQNKTVISPYLKVPYKTKSNYWGMMDHRGKPKRGGQKYLDFSRNGLLSVPCVGSAYLVNMSALSTRKLVLNYTDDDEGSLLCLGTGDNSPFYLSTPQTFGHLIATPNPFHAPLRIDPNKIYSELFELYDNPYDWELVYLHPKWRQAPEIMEQPCPDVYWFPLLSEKFCRDLIELMENAGGWTVGTNYQPTDGSSHPNWDPYPTVDIDLRRVGLHNHWLEIVERYVRPLQLKVFGGHDRRPFIDTSIVIRYRPEEQSSNRPHHDTSTYTINMALNTGFEGGGCRFLRQNCSVTESRVGWVLIHPGDLTHLHEGLSTTKGTRYILVSFIDPREKDKFEDEEEWPEPEGGFVTNTNV